MAHCGYQERTALVFFHLPSCSGVFFVLVTIQRQMASGTQYDEVLFPVVARRMIEMGDRENDF